jgi:beta-mannosidase
MSSTVLALDPISARDGVHPLLDWSLARTQPGEIARPSQLEHAVSDWTSAPVPGTVAQALQAAGLWNIDREEDFDASDWWYRCRFDVPPDRVGAGWSLRFEGLATLAEVWLNDEPILTADNMFQCYRVDPGRHLRASNELMIGFRSLTAALSARRPRPRWKTRLVSHQQLRWFRTTLLGRIPGWSPPVAPVGPWRPVMFEDAAHGAIEDVQRRSFLDGEDGVVDLMCSVPVPDHTVVSGEFSIGDVWAPLNVERLPGGCRLAGRVRVAAPRLWYPHTHGSPSLYASRVRIEIDGRVIERECDPVGFRRIDAGDLRDGFRLRINECPVFCRGACWTCSDIATLSGSRADLVETLTRLRDAGANMVRVGGTMIYESDEFYRLCDELGLLVWQDFMFANMDYPVSDEAFLRTVTAEAAQQLQRLSRHPAVAVYCGNSEVEQQAAMLGMPQEAWSNRWFGELLPRLCERYHPGVPYVPSTPCEGALPFHVGTGIAHYYGVGAYLRPLSDVRRSDVKFTSECLGFANVPEPAVVDRLMRGDPPAIHDSRWKRRTPRDTGAGWDFEDVRDHYLGTFFGEDPARLRAVDSRRYLEISRVTTGEMMSRTFAEWRSRRSHCGGALVWFLKDLWPGAGWGILDSDAAPKACFYYLQRAWRSRAVMITDEGLDGLHFHVVNETERPLAGTLELALLRDGRVVTAQARVGCQVDPRGLATFGSEELLGGFHDTAYAYRFGPLVHTVVAATLLDDTGAVLDEAFVLRESR